MSEIFTIGHSTHSWEEFLALLLRHRIEAIGDVRSNPYSARFPQYNCKTVESALRSAGIQYVFLGTELGARRSERECYVDGIARYDRIARTGAFRAGLRRVQSGAPRFRLALMCAERDPLECHRTILICRHLRNDLQIYHILSSGSLETQAAAENRLLAEEGIPSSDFFVTKEDLISQAYDQRGGKIAYHECATSAEQAQ